MHLCVDNMSTDSTVALESEAVDTEDTPIANVPSEDEEKVRYTH